MILGEVEEIYRTSSEAERVMQRTAGTAGDSDSEDSDDEVMTCEIKRNFDMLFVRGDCVVLVSPPLRTSRPAQ